MQRFERDQLRAAVFAFVGVGVIVDVDTDDVAQFTVDRHRAHPQADIAVSAGLDPLIHLCSNGIRATAPGEAFRWCFLRLRR